MSEEYEIKEINHIQKKEDTTSKEDIVKRRLYSAKKYAKGGRGTFTKLQKEYEDAGYHVTTLKNDLKVIRDKVGSDLLAAGLMDIMKQALGGIHASVDLAEEIKQPTAMQSGWLQILRLKENQERRKNELEDKEITINFKVIE